MQYMYLINFSDQPKKKEEEMILQASTSTSILYM